MFPTTDNPAARLLAILSDAKGKDGNLPVSRVFGEIFGFGPEDRVSFFRSIGHLNTLIDQIESRVKQLPSLNHGLYLRDIPAIRSVVCPNGYNEAWNTYLNPLRFGVLTSLEFCANELSKNHQEVSISNDQIANLKAQLTELYKSVRSANLDPDLTSVIIDLLSTIQLALDYYKIQGPDGIKRSLVYAVGLTQLHQSRLKDSKDLPTIKQLYVFVSDLVTLIKTAYKLKELGGGLRELINLQN